MCPIGDPFRARGDLARALDAIDRAPAGVFLYVFNKARTSFAHSFSRQVQANPDEERTYAGHIEGAPHSEVLRDFGLGAQVLFDLGCRKIHLMSNSDRRIVGLEGFGIEVVERVPLPLAGAARVVSLPARSDKT